MKLPVVIFMLGWFAALAFAAWALWNSGHHVWAVVVPLIGVGGVTIKG